MLEELTPEQEALVMDKLRLAFSCNDGVNCNRPIREDAEQCPWCRLWWKADGSSTELRGIFV